MARRRTRSHLELREQFDAAERRKPDEEEVEEEDDEDEDEDEEAEEGEGEPPADSDEEGGGDEDDEDAPPKKKKKAKKPVEKAPAKPKRTRTPKVIRQKVVWKVFNNSNQCVATFDYPKHQDAVDHAAKLQGDKKQTFFVQPVKEPIEEKKEKEKE